MATLGKINAKMLGLNVEGWRLAAKYGQWCRVLIERNRKLDDKLRIRSAKLGQERAYARDCRAALVGAYAQVRRLTQELAEAKRDALPERWTRQLHDVTVSLPIYARYLEERNRKLDDKLRIRSAKLGRERAYARDYRAALEISHAQVRRLTLELEEKNNAAG